MIYGKEFVGEYNQTGMIGGDPIPKLLNYSKTEAKLYQMEMTSASAGGNFLLEFLFFL